MLEVQLGKDKDMHTHMEPLGVYSDLELALQQIDELEEYSEENKMFMYDLQEFAVNEPPVLLKLLKKERERKQKKGVSKGHERT